MLSIILPTFNEAQNVPVMVAGISKVVAGREHEIIIVDDDSPDGTWKTAEALKTAYPSLRVLCRRDKRGLSSAVVDGFSMAKGDVLAVMDADGQHDAGLLVKLEDAVRSGADIAIGSRYVAGGSVGDWKTIRKFLSRAGTRLAYALLRVKVRDPMSGFFAVRADMFRKIQPALNPKGFKVLLDVLVNTPRNVRVIEVPFTFGLRMAGESKLSGRVQLEFLSYVYQATIGRLISLQALIFLLLTALILGYFLPRAFALSPLYLSSAVRSDAMHAITTVADREGWMRSDIELMSVDGKGMRIVHRRHGLSAVQPECFDVSFDVLQLVPCAG